MKSETCGFPAIVVDADFSSTQIQMAEGEGFEPPVPFQVQQFSRLPVSTTHTSLRWFYITTLGLVVPRVTLVEEVS